MNKNIFLFLPLLALLILNACKEDEPVDNTELNIVETAQATSDLSSLVEALQAANLVSALEGSGPFTVFAPTNAAFQDLLDSNPAWNSISDIPVDVLQSVLLFHVVSGEVRAADLSDTYVNTLSTGPNSENLSLQVSTSGGVLFNGSAEPVLTDIETSNGVVHLIDAVMLPKSIPGFALSNSNFSTLVAALTDSRHTTDYVSLLSGAGPFTVFAPTNAAFQALLDSEPTWNSLADIDINVLEAVLNYHVVNNANVQADQLSDGQQITMFDGGTVTVDLSSGAKLNGSVNIILTDVQGTNGVIHAIDAVLIP
ncbi:MAG: fasciclin domain-containing protein [Chitinophagales bacterium]|nr:fasciclin domain-containing protein [Bacteroidota bacterium]MCB9257503.1 fasciclin domain-containing protein [Chitinophagales bacterium]